MKKEQEEINYVAEAQNWEQRIAVENESAKIWDKNWGSLYNPTNNNPEHNNADHDYESRIKVLQEQMDKIQVPRIASWTRVSYKRLHDGYREWQDFRRRSSQQAGGHTGAG